MPVDGAVDRWFDAGDDIGRALDEATAVLRASEDLEAIMSTIRDSESPVAARRALKEGFDLSGRQAAILLTMPIMAFTRSERDQLRARRRSRMDLLGDVTGLIPVVSEQKPKPISKNSHPVSTSHSLAPAHLPSPHPVSPPTPTPHLSAGLADPMNSWNNELDSVMSEFDAVLSGCYAPAIEHKRSGPPIRAVARPKPQSAQCVAQQSAPAIPSSLDTQVERYSSFSPTQVLDEQIGELCEAIATMLWVDGPAHASVEDPRKSSSRPGAILDGCGVDDSTGIRTYLWHMHRTGLDAVTGLMPFVDPLTAQAGFGVQAEQFENAVSTGDLGSYPSPAAAWSAGLWPLADRRGYGYAVLHRDGNKSGLGLSGSANGVSSSHQSGSASIGSNGSAPAGSVWAYGGGEPLQLLWDSLIDMLAELYRALAEGRAFDSALARIENGRVVWTNLV